MSLLTALDDLRSRTLALIPGLLGRLEYLSSLRSEGRYAHWGLARTHGERRAQRSLVEAHEMLVSEILQSPLSVLIEESEAACEADGRDTPDYLEQLRSKDAALLPEEKVSQATSLHFSSVLCALSALTRAQRNANRPGA